MTSRVGEIGTLVLAAEQAGQRAGWSLVVLLIIASLILYVTGKVSIVRLGYRIEDAGAREEGSGACEPFSPDRGLQPVRRRRRIEEIAVKRMGMVRPPKENVVTVKRRAVPAE